MCFKKIIGGLLIFFSSSCTPMCRQYDQTPPMQRREVQTRNFESADPKTVMKAMINVLQDEGYVVKGAVLDLGLLTAEKDVDLRGEYEPCMMDWYFMCDTRYPKHVVLEMTANVSEYGDDTRVRVNFQKRLYDNYGCVLETNQMMDDHDYRDFFAKVSRGVFFQIENL